MPQESTTSSPYQGKSYRVALIPQLRDVSFRRTCHLGEHTRKEEMKLETSRAVLKSMRKSWPPPAVTFHWQAGDKGKGEQFYLDSQDSTTRACSQLPSHHRRLRNLPAGPCRSGSESPAGTSRETLPKVPSAVSVPPPSVNVARYRQAVFKPPF